MYGMVAGLAFASAAWGYDGYLLWQAHAYFPWIKLISGGLLSMLVGGLAGWLTTRFEKALLGLVFWVAASALFAWFTSIIPFVVAPALLGMLSPEIGSLLAYETFPEMSTRIGVAFAWILIAASITAVIQIPLVEQAAFSYSQFSKITPNIVCAFVMIVSGAFVDSLNNQPTREAIIGLDQTIQFSLDHRGEEIDKVTSRQMHLAAFRSVQDSLDDERRLVITSFDTLMENIYVAVNFNGQWVDCLTVVGSPINCKAITP